MKHTDLTKIGNEIGSAAQWCAERGLKGVQGDPLPNLMTWDAVCWINNNQYRFRRVVEWKAFRLKFVRLREYLGG